MLKIRLRRMGARNAPFYRVVLSDSRKVPTSRAIEELGFYDPRQKPSTIRIDHSRVEHWVGHGALLSETVARLVKRGNTSTTAAPVVEGAPAEAPSADAKSAKGAKDTKGAKDAEDAKSGAEATVVVEASAAAAGESAAEGSTDEPSAS